MIFLNKVKNNTFRLLVLLFALQMMEGMAQEQEAPQTAASTLEDRIISLQEKILGEGRTTQNLSEEDLASLPIGIYKQTNGLEYMILIDSAKFTTRGAFFNAYIVLEFTTTGKKLVFAGRNIAFQPGGLSVSTGSRLILVNNAPFDIVKDKITLNLLANQNYVEFDCNGFKSVNLKGAFVFSRDVLVPDESSGQYQSTERPNNPSNVTATFQVNSTDWGSLMTTINFTPFMVPSLKGLSFTVTDAIMDFSDVANPPNFQFPADYTHSFGSNINLWEGFFLREVKVKLFDELKTKNGRKEITAQNLIIDKIGVSGMFGVTPLFNREEGTMDGWPFSVDSIGVIIVKNQLRGGAFKGEVNIPMFDKDTPCKYRALVAQGTNGGTDFIFNIQPGRNLKADVLAADVEIYKTSTLTIAVIDGKFKPEALLHGHADIKGGDKLNIKALKFTNLHIISEAPYIKGGTWALTTTNGKADTKTGKDDGQNDIGKFPIVINRISFTHSQSMLRLGVEATLNLMNSSDKGFAATASVQVNGELVVTEERVGEEMVRNQDWKFKGIQVSDILIEAQGGVYSIYGRLSLYDNDKIYGNGFRGEVDATFTPGPKIKAIAQFGSVNGLRYWYVDGSVMLPAPIGTGFGVYGFGGGMYYHMILEQENKYEVDDFVNVNGAADKTSVGKSRSGARYVPSADIGLGLKATVILGTLPSPEPFNGDATFEIAFNSNGGVRLIRFRGEGYFMTPIEKRSAQVPIYADLDILYDFSNKSLHANLDTYVNVAGGMLKGIHPGGLAGSAVLHFDPEDWYIHIGTPEQRIGLNFIGMFQTTSYFMVGTLVSPMPTPPSRVSEILGGMNLDFMRDENKLANGGGFAFGSSLEMNTGRLEVLIFYGQFSAGAGFDVMLKNYRDAHCVGSTSPIGINGWYASGQAWAYVQGNIGVFVNLKFIKGEFEILRIGAAAVLQAKLPNPFWMQGVVGGEFSVLGGLVKGNCRFKVTIGQMCEIEGVSSVTGVKVIAEVQPKSNDPEVSVFTAPQVAFNVPVNKEFEMMDANNNYKAYRVKLEHLNVTSNSVAIAGALQWNEASDVVIFNPSEILPPRSTVKVDVKVTWEEKVNGAWRAMGTNGNTESEADATSFSTGDAPSFIPEENVQYSYPVTGQFNFHKSEYAQGYMKLKMGQNYLFGTQENGQTWNLVARFIAAGQITGIDVPLVYEQGNAFIRYTLPTNLTNDKPYMVRFVKVPTVQNVIDQNVSSSDVQLSTSEAGDVSTQMRDIEGTLTLAEEKQLYESYFKTSKFNTFLDKINSMTGYLTVGRIIPGIEVAEPAAWGYVSEVFDKVDLSGHNQTAALIGVEALPNNPWYLQYTYPRTYQYYPVSSSIKIGWRNPEPVGIPPLKGMYIEQNITTPELQADDVLTNSVSVNTSGRITYAYALTYYTYRDFYDLKNKAFDQYLNSISSAPIGAKNLLFNSYYDIVNGQYQFKLIYRLPGLNTVTTSKTFSIDW